MLKYIVVARHGRCDNSITNRQLTEKGEAQMKRLIIALNPFLAGISPLRIYSSIARWAIQNAEILGGGYGVRPIEFPALFMADPNNDLRNVAKLITSPVQIDANAVLLVTHERGTSHLAGHCSEIFLKKRQRFSALWPGEAYVFDCQRQKIFKIYSPEVDDNLDTIEI